MSLNLRDPFENAQDGRRAMPLAKAVNAFLPYIERRISTLTVPGLDRDDLRQEAFVALFLAIESYDGTKAASFSTYAIACINNRLADAVRAASRQKNKLLNESVSLSDDSQCQQLAAGMPLEDLAILKEEYRTVCAHMEGMLSGLERETLSLWLRGYSSREIAQRLGVEPKSAANALQRARRKLKQQE